MCLQRSSSSWSGCVSESGLGMRSERFLLAFGVKLELGDLMGIGLKEAGEQRNHPALEHLWAG